MKAISLLFAITFLSYFHGGAQPSKSDLLVNQWKYSGVEEFGVVTPPDSLEKNDLLIMKSDGTFEWLKSGKKISGTYKLNESAKILSFTDASTKKTLNYNLKKVSAADLTIEYQTPDLVRTRYRFMAAPQ